MQNLIDRCVNERVWAVVGVSTDETKFGTRIFRDLKRAGYEVYGVHPTVTELDGERIYPDLASLPVKPAVVDVVVPPRAARSILEACLAAGIRNVWFQPGAEDREAIEWGRQQGLDLIYGGPCAMVEKKRWS